jgi:hypothetical protein
MMYYPNLPNQQCFRQYLVDRFNCDEQSVEAIAVAKTPAQDTKCSARREAEQMSPTKRKARWLRVRLYRQK